MFPFFANNVQHIKFDALIVQNNKFIQWKWSKQLFSFALSPLVHTGYEENWSGVLPMTSHQEMAPYRLWRLKRGVPRAKSYLPIALKSWEIMGNGCQIHILQRKIHMEHLLVKIRQFRRFRSFKEIRIFKGLMCQHCLFIWFVSINTIPAGLF